jgi:BirA family biotin operon repressor/biotin-[acetyl-CoA-carboxylase] ligase
VVERAAAPGGAHRTALVVGVGVVRALRAAGGVEAMLKWPNDLVVGVESPLKLGGILAERLADGAVIVGVGINVDQRGDEMPEGATSLRACGATGTREELLKSILASVAGTYRSWCAGADLSDEYAAMSATLGSIVDADIGDRVLRGRAVALGPAGELLVETADGGRESVSAGDVTRVRPAH